MRVWITDRWMGADLTTGKKTVKKARDGVGSRWQVSQYAEQPDGTKRLVSRNFERLTDAEAFRPRPSTMSTRVATARSRSRRRPSRMLQPRGWAADASMTLNIYADLWPDRLDEVVEAASRRREAALRR